MNKTNIKWALIIRHVLYFCFLKLCFVVENVLCMCCWCDVLCYCSMFLLLGFPCFCSVSLILFFRQSNETHRTRTWNKEQEHRKLTKKKKNYQTINTRSKNPKLRTHPTTHNIQQKQTINDKNNINSACIISWFSFAPEIVLTLFVVLVVGALSFVLVMCVCCCVCVIVVLCLWSCFCSIKSYEQQRTRTWNKAHEQ